MDPMWALLDVGLCTVRQRPWHRPFPHPAISPLIIWEVLEEEAAHLGHYFWIAWSCSCRRLALN